MLLYNMWIQSKSSPFGLFTIKEAVYSALTVSMLVNDTGNKDSLLPWIFPANGIMM